jgi:DNA modification methylase
MNTDIEIIAREKLFERLSNKLETAYQFNRQIVSFQANKKEPIYRWFKYKEGFSTALVKYFLKEYSTKPGKILDPFAGAGTTLFTAQEEGWESTGIELLPVGAFVMKVRQSAKNVDLIKLKSAIEEFWRTHEIIKPTISIEHISITKDAFSEETENYLNKYISFSNSCKDDNVSNILKFAAFSILEEISFTRKDGQYLRWDHRSKRSLNGKPFDKGRILPFKEALELKLNQILQDLSGSNQVQTLFDSIEKPKFKEFPVNVIEGTCLKELPKIPSDVFDFVVTSPPYCNRYDYTRTYALELVYLGLNNDEVSYLRQKMLSCTVENKEKLQYLEKFYRSLNQLDTFNKVIDTYNSCDAMQEVNFILDEFNRIGELNNKNIARMVKNYFFEMAFVIYELSRVMKSGGYCVMVNDNVRYGGEEIPVDLILSEFAENFNFDIEKIFVLPKGKGNSSQQMGKHGRTEIRKCVYLWKKK